MPQIDPSLRTAMRTVFVPTSLALASLSLGGTAAAQEDAAAGTFPQVRIAGGAVAGRSDGRVDSFKGIPYAAAPVGELRWRAPRPAAPWEATRDAGDFAPDCMQAPFPGDAYPAGRVAEDCLYANVWKPSGDQAGLPVIVWIYGGGFVNGSTSNPYYDGSRLAGEDVVFVSFNYRLGRFGTFAFPQLTREQGAQEPLGNYGTMDQLAALRWVQENIAAFGGDPDNVTLVGESVGGISIHTLMTSPPAQGLFDRVAILSGGDGASQPDRSLARAERIGIDFARDKGIDPADPRALAKLRALDADAVTDGLSIAWWINPGEPLTYSPPFVDGKVAFGAQEAYEAGAFAHVPVMIGATSDDMGGPRGFQVRDAHVKAQTLAGQTQVYAYRFGYVASASDAPGAAHASDIPYWFDTVDAGASSDVTQRDRQVATKLSGYLLSFAKTGRPGTGADGPAWKPYASRTMQIMRFLEGGALRFEADPIAAELDRASEVDKAGD
ncbi:carboxylesterase family protein [Novosphingobium sp. YJ-S2-02]|uniref:Carboxylesterase family protein n=1 Tax=Novosphingobium aureum TaxID=2792964 RepID=A0A931HB60_9SPHN|nr:carboxylesterase family protein [Novosphingobium aureum]MBH0112592.1 carboxylesterase family protein [Novosphingobium aureum]